MKTLETKRLVLRQWKVSDLEPFAHLNRDPKVMEFFPALSSYEESEAHMRKMADLITKNGWGFWAVSL
jgi:3-dehydroquinate dehydratase/shikimate dehydrogenase